DGRAGRCGLGKEGAHPGAGSADAPGNVNDVDARAGPGSENGLDKPLGASAPEAIVRRTAEHDKSLSAGLHEVSRRLPAARVIGRPHRWHGGSHLGPRVHQHNRDSCTFESLELSHGRSDETDDGACGSAVLDTYGPIVVECLTLGGENDV